MTIQPERVRALNDAPPREGADYVLYWMQQSQRVPFNPALEWAVEAANARGLPVLVAFGLTDGRDGYPEANARHYAFLLQGLADVAAGLAERGIAFRLMRGAPDRVALDFADRAALVVCDRGYLGVQRRWRERVAREAGCAVVQVEGDVVVPVETASGKHEIGARTLRPACTGSGRRTSRPCRPAPSARGRAGSTCRTASTRPIPRACSRASPSTARSGRCAGSAAGRWRPSGA